MQVASILMIRMAKDLLRGTNTEVLPRALVAVIENVVLTRGRSHLEVLKTKISLVICLGKELAIMVTSVDIPMTRRLQLPHRVVHQTSL